MCKPSHNNLDDYYVAIVDKTPKNIIQQYEDEAQVPDVSCQPKVCRNDGTQLEKHEQDQSSGQMDHVSHEKVLTYDKSRQS